MVNSEFSSQASLLVECLITSNLRLPFFKPSLLRFNQLLQLTLKGKIFTTYTALYAVRIRVLFDPTTFEKVNVARWIC